MVAYLKAKNTSSLWLSTAVGHRERAEDRRTRSLALLCYASPKRVSYMGHQGRGAEADLHCVATPALVANTRHLCGMLLYPLCRHSRGRGLSDPWRAYVGAETSGSVLWKRAWNMHTQKALHA
jgi:hypothetical protein